MSRNIIFIVTSLRRVNTGIGGHYRSVKEISNLLSQNANVKVFTFGDVQSPVFHGDEKYSHIHSISALSPTGLIRLRNALKDFLTKNSAGGPIAVISVGWIFSYGPAFLSSLGLGTSLHHLKPGGDAARFPSLLNGIPIAVFHQKDYDTFSRIEPRRKIALVPGRVSSPPYDEEYLKRSDRPFLSSKKIQSLCIMRIASDKKKPSALIYDALSHLNGKPVANLMTFTHCGTIQDDTLYSDIRNRSFDFETAIVSDSHTTKSAPKYLHGHDVAIGIGRSVVEAMSLGIPVFIPILNSQGRAILCAVTEENWRQFLYENFTHRADFKDIASHGNLIELEDFLLSAELRARLSREVRAVYDNNLSPSASLQAWLEFLGKDTAPSGMLGDLKRALYLAFLEVKRLLQILMK